jgi:hypothetical protein
MKRAVVVKMYGDVDMATQIADPMTKVIPVDDSRMQMVIAENKRLTALNGVRSYGDSVRFESVSKALAIKYAVKPVGRVRGAVLTAWACLWMAVYNMGEYLVEWNRRG